MKLTNVARASLEELDYEDFLRQRNLIQWPHVDSRCRELIELRISSANEFALWAKQISERDKISIEESAANGALILIRVACSLLNKQLAAQAESFQNDGGFTERLYKMRSTYRN